MFRFLKPDLRWTTEVWQTGLLADLDCAVVSCDKLAASTSGCRCGREWWIGGTTLQTPNLAAAAASSPSRAFVMGAAFVVMDGANSLAGGDITARFDSAQFSCPAFSRRDVFNKTFFVANRTKLKAFTG
jgi:hypothetical protein